MSLLEEPVDINPVAWVSELDASELDAWIRRLQRAKRRLQRAASAVPQVSLEYVTIQQDTWAQAEGDVRSMVDAYYLEVRAESQPDHLLLVSESYEALEAQGRLVVVTVRDNGKLVGFSGWTIIQHHHFADVLTGVDDSWYLAKPYRQGFVGLRLFQKALELLKAAGCKQCIASTSVAKNVEVLLLREGFEPMEILHSKKL